MCSLYSSPSSHSLAGVATGLWTSKRYCGTALHVAARVGNAAAVKVIGGGEGVDGAAQEDGSEGTPAHVAAAHGR